MHMCIEYVISMSKILGSISCFGEVQFRMRLLTNKTINVRTAIETELIVN